MRLTVKPDLCQLSRGPVRFLYSWSSKDMKKHSSVFTVPAGSTFCFFGCPHELQPRRYLRVKRVDPKVHGKFPLCDFTTSLPDKEARCALSSWCPLAHPVVYLTSAGPPRNLPGSHPMQCSAVITGRTTAAHFGLDQCHHADRPRPPERLCGFLIEVQNRPCFLMAVSFAFKLLCQGYKTHLVPAAN